MSGSPTSRLAQFNLRGSGLPGRECRRRHRVFRDRGLQRHPRKRLQQVGKHLLPTRAFEGQIAERVRYRLISEFRCLFPLSGPPALCYSSIFLRSSSFAADRPLRSDGLDRRQPASPMRASSIAFAGSALLLPNSTCGMRLPGSTTGTRAKRKSDHDFDKLNGR